MDNFDNAISATDTAFASMGSAMRENQTYLENSIEAHRKALKAEYENLVSSIPLEQLEKKLIDIGTAILKLVNNDIVQLTAQVTALVAIFALGTKAVSAFQAVLSGGSGFAVFINLLGQVIAGETTLTAVTSFLTTTLLANPLFWGAVAVAGVVAIVKIVDKLTVSFKEATKALEESNSAYKQAQSDIQSLTQQIKELEQAKDKINQDKLEIADDTQLQKLQQQTDELERQEATLQRQLALAKAKAEVAQQDAKKSAQDALSSTVETDKTNIVGYGQIGGKGGTLGTRFEGAITSLQSLQDKIVTNNREIEKLNQNYDENKKQVDELTAKNEILKQAYEATYKEATTLAETAQDVSDALGEETKAYDGSSTTIGGLIDVFDRLVGWKTDATDKTTKLTTAIEDEEDALQAETNAANALEEAFEKAIKPLSDIENNYSTLTKAVDEFNNKGGFTASTIKKLSELDAEWLSLLQLTNGQLVLNEEALQKLAEANKQEAISALQAQAAQDMHNVALGNLEALSPIAKSAIAEITQATQDEANAATQAAAANFLEVESLKAKEEAAKGGHYNGNTQDAFNMINAIMSKYQGMIDNMNSWTLDFGDTSSSTSKSTKDAWVEAFKEEQRQLKHSLEMNEITEYEYYEKLKALNEKYFGEISGKHDKYLKEYQENEEEIYKGLKSIYDKVRDYLAEAVEKGYEKAIKALQKEEKKLIDGIKKSIDALKKEKQQTLDNIKDEINALKKQKENAQKYWNDQIDSIKKENDVLQEQNELLQYQQALQQAKAQKVMVFQNGKFQLGENESAVAQAEQNLSQYQDQLSYEQQIEQLENLRDAQVESIEARIESLEEYYDYMEDYYDKQIEAMEEYRDKVQEEYDARVEALQAELDAFKEGLQQEKDIEDERLYNQALGMEERANIYKQELTNLKSYINQANAMLTQLGNAGAQVDFAFEPLTKSRSLGTKSSSNVQVAARASGDASFKGNEIALVGESPNTELVLGSRINQSVNSGTLMNLAKGSGVVNAESTSTLAGLLNTLSTPSIANNNRTTQQNFNFGSISLPNVTNADTFVNTLSNKFNNYALQYGNTHK